MARMDSQSAGSRWFMVLSLVALAAALLLVGRELTRTPAAAPSAAAVKAARMPAVGPAAAGGGAPESSTATPPEAARNQ